MVAKRFDALPAEVSTRLDSLVGPGAGVFFKRQLEHVLPEVLEEKRAPLNAFRFLVTDTSVPEYARTYTQRMWGSLGIAEWISNYASDLKNVAVHQKEETFNVRPMGNAVSYSVEDIMVAMNGGMSLDSALLSAAKIAAEEKINSVAWNGDESVGLHGVLNYPYIPRVAVADPISSATAADTIIRNLVSLAHDVHDWTNGIGRPDTLLLPLNAYTYIATTPRSTTSDTTILEFVLKTSPFLTSIEPCHELGGAGPNGEDLVLCYPRGDRRVLRHVLPMPWRPYPAQERNLAFVIPTMAKSGGVASDFPLEACIGVLP